VTVVAVSAAVDVLSDVASPAIRPEVTYRGVVMLVVLPVVVNVTDEFVVFQDCKLHALASHLTIDVLVKIAILQLV